VVLAAGACRSGGDIPMVDGPLAIEVRYPAAEPVAVTDSVSVWGSVGSGRATLRVNGRRVPVAPSGGFAAFVALPAGDRPALELEARLGREVARRTVPVARAVAGDAPAPHPVPEPATGWVRVRRLPDPALDSATLARPVFARWTPGGALAIPLPQGVLLPAEARAGDAIRLRLARGVAAWIPAADAEPAAAPAAAPVTLRALRITPGAGRTVVTLEAGRVLAGHVEAVPGRLRWTLYGATAAPGSAAAAGGVVAGAELRDAGGGQVVVDLSLRGAPLGWRVTWVAGRQRLEVREHPAPGLAGLVVALDPGHPPLGSTGPTGLREDSVTLAVARDAARRLAALGARPVLTRTDPLPVSLDQRLAVAEAADAHVFVSIHVNAPGDGRPPESVDGTRVYWLDPRTLPLARVLKDSVAAGLGQVPVATVQSSLAVLRATWFPAVLVEGTALSLPAREALLRTPQGVAGYAAGVVRGVLAWAAGPLP
jgi:N-acetylmuramoyl-L-alanine amidase